ncbi:MAG: hypothetical protein ABI442_20730 [Gemmatimonadaceae bacterium]
MKRILITIVAFAAACGKSDAPPAKTATATDSATPRTGASCPATGLWSECQVIYHLERAGVAPKVDSTAKPAEKLKGTPLIMKIGLNALLEIYIYADSASRIADEKTLDRTQFVADTMPQTMNHERTIIESVNLLGLLTSLNSHQRERVSDAIIAGPPQAEKR